MAYPTSLRETLADAVVHGAGLLIAGGASAALLMQLARQSDPTPIWSVAAYCALMLFSFAVSAAYHMTPLSGRRRVLHKVDHAAIYLKIAGTYTPLVVLIGSGFAYAILGLVWFIAVVGALAKLTVWAANGKGSLTLYLGMGWLSTLLIWPMWQTLPGAATGLIALGGLIYSLGTLVYVRKGMSYQNAIWHFIVLTASGCFFAAITLAAIA